MYLAMHGHRYSSRRRRDAGPSFAASSFLSRAAFMWSFAAAVAVASSSSPLHHAFRGVRAYASPMEPAATPPRVELCDEASRTISGDAEELEAAAGGYQITDCQLREPDGEAEDGVGWLYFSAADGVAFDLFVGPNVSFVGNTVGAFTLAVDAVSRFVFDGVSVHGGLSFFGKSVPGSSITIVNSAFTTRVSYALPAIDIQAGLFGSDVVVANNSVLLTPSEPDDAYFTCINLCSYDEGFVASTVVFEGNAVDITADLEVPEYVALVSAYGFVINASVIARSNVFQYVGMAMDAGTEIMKTNAIDIGMLRAEKSLAPSDYSYGRADIYDNVFVDIADVVSITASSMYANITRNVATSRRGMISISYVDITSPVETDPLTGVVTSAYFNAAYIYDNSLTATGGAVNFLLWLSEALRIGNVLRVEDNTCVAANAEDEWFEFDVMRQLTVEWDSNNHNRLGTRGVGDAGADVDGAIFSIARNTLTQAPVTTFGEVRTSNAILSETFVLFYWVGIAPVDLATRAPIAFPMLDNTAFDNVPINNYTIGRFTRFHSTMTSRNITYIKAEAFHYNASSPFAEVPVPTLHPAASFAPSRRGGGASSVGIATAVLAVTAVGFFVAFL